MSDYYASYRMNYHEKNCIILSHDNDDDDKSIFLMKESGEIHTFDNMKCVSFFSKQMSIDIDDPMDFYIDDFLNKLNQFKSNISYSSEFCDILLSGWNILEEYLYSCDQTLDLYSDNTNSINICYDKLLRAVNVPALMISDEEYHPLWTQREVLVIRSYLLKACNSFIAKIF